MAYRPTPALTRTSHTPSPPPEPFDPTLTPLEVFQRIWDSFYVGLDPITPTEDDDGGMAEGSGKGGWDTQTCSIYLSELRVGVEEYWKQSESTELPSSLTLEESEDDTPSSTSSSFTFESFNPTLPSSNFAQTHRHTVTPFKSPPIDPTHKFPPHVSYIACTPISENLLGPTIDPLQRGKVVQRIEFVPFADDARFLILASSPKVVQSGKQEKREKGKGKAREETEQEQEDGDGDGDESQDEMDVDGSTTLPTNLTGTPRKRSPTGRIALFLPDSSESDVDADVEGVQKDKDANGDYNGKEAEGDQEEDEEDEEKPKGYLDFTFGTAKNHYEDAVQWTWISSGENDDPDYESIQLETVRRLHHQYHLSLDDISRALPGFGRVVVDDVYDTISIDHPEDNAPRRRKLSWLTPRDTLSWTGALPESIIPPLTIGYLKELFSVREVASEDETSSSEDSDSDDDTSEREDSSGGEEGMAFGPSRRSKGKRGMKRGREDLKGKGKQRASTIDDDNDDEDEEFQYPEDEGEEGEPVKPLEVTRRTLFDEVQHSSGVWCSNVECMKVWRGGCVVHRYPRIQPGYPKLTSTEYPSLNDEDVPPYIYSKPSKKGRHNKGKAKAKAAGKEEECGRDCFRRLIPSENDRPADDSDLLWAIDSTDLNTLKSILQIEPDALPCYLAGIMRKPCMEVFANRRRLYPDKQIQKNMIIDELEGTKDKRNVTLLRDYRYRMDDAMPDPPPTQAPCSHPGACTKRNCTCFNGNRRCVRGCRCSVGCSIRFKGCQCGKSRLKSKSAIKGGASSKPCCTENSACPCWKELRECDPELCRWCGFKGTKKKAKCENRKLQAGKVYPVEIKKTKWGQGAVAVRPIPAGAVVGEYFGELEPLNEGEDLRESIATFDGLNYAFSFNQRFVLDSKWVGNETRYLNHDLNNPNCGADLVTVNDTQKIVLRTNQRIEARQELFLNYGDKYWVEKGGDPSLRPGGDASAQPSPVKGKNKEGTSVRVGAQAPKRGGRTGMASTQSSSQSESGNDETVAGRMAVKTTTIKATRQVAQKSVPGRSGYREPSSEEDSDRMDEGSD
ncbi:hypothetical protein BKA70DRAFT_451227 [Coprinopsis sp. MPI-PUGE-AT-0042]|nr:hypothetical protein BKA70DRAFT_451227 [Coprinopsis sp. MPI-PUGE-AT-0042]